MVAGAIEKRGMFAVIDDQQRPVIHNCDADWPAPHLSIWQNEPGLDAYNKAGGGVVSCFPGHYLYGTSM
jgi:hypothetical protein